MLAFRAATPAASRFPPGAARAKKAGVNDELPAVPRRHRFLHPGWWLCILALAACGWLGWREYDHRAAIREARAANFKWTSVEPFEIIRGDWRAAFRMKTWAEPVRVIDVGPRQNLTRLRPLLLRLRPTDLRASQCQDSNADALRGLSPLRELLLSASPSLQNVDALRGLPALQYLNLHGCKGLQNVDGLAGLHRLQTLDLSYCDALQNLDALRGLTGLQFLSLMGCPAVHDADVLQNLTGLKDLFLVHCPNLQNVDAVKALTGLTYLDIRDCPKLPEKAVEELRAALPQTEFAPPGTER